MNYVDSDHVIDELANIHSKGYDIEVDWKTRTFTPGPMVSDPIKKSIDYWGDSLSKHLASHNVELEKLELLKFV